MDKTEILGGTPKNGLNRRKFLRGMAATAGLGLGAGILAACGDNTPTSLPAATIAPTTAPAATTAAATSAAPTTAVTTTSAATTAAATTVAATTSAPTTAAASTTAAATTSAATTSAAAGATPAGYVAVGKISAAEKAPVAFSSGATKGYVFVKSPTEVYTYSNICTHMGCEVPAYKTTQNMFMCPCHGSEYTNTGEVIQGPAKARLPLFDNKVVGDVIYAKLS